MEALYNVGLSKLPVIVVMVVPDGRTHSPARNDSTSLSYYCTRSAVPNKVPNFFFFFWRSDVLGSKR